MGQPNRREFLKVVGAAACACAMGPGLAEAADAADPVDIGTIADYPADGVYDALARSHKLLVMRHEGRLYACTAACTHKSQTLRVKDGQLGCPAHSSKFSIDGTPTGGPAKRALDRFAITRRDDGHFAVDRSRTFEQAKWDDPDAHVKL